MTARVVHTAECCIASHMADENSKMIHRVEDLGADFLASGFSFDDICHGGHPHTDLI